MTTLNIRLTDWIEQRLNEEAARENKTRSEVARDALTWYLTEIKKNALHGIPGRSARSIRQRKYLARRKINRRKNSCHWKTKHWTKLEANYPAICSTLNPAENGGSNPSRGQEIGKIRPVLVFQDNALTAIETPMIVILLLTTQVYPSFKQCRVTVTARHRLLRDVRSLSINREPLTAPDSGRGRWPFSAKRKWKLSNALSSAFAVCFITLYVHIKQFGASKPTNSVSILARLLGRALQGL